MRGSIFPRRAKYARGVVEAYEARSCKGNELVERTLDAIAIITEGMELAKANPRSGNGGKTRSPHVSTPHIPLPTPLLPLPLLQRPHPLLARRHTFLIYNGSVHFWHASWVLQRAGMRKHVVEPTQRVVQFLQSVQGQNTWRARLQIALARGLAEVGRTDEATKTLAEAKALAVAAGDIDIQKEVVTVSTHLTYLAGKGKTEGSTPSEQALSIAQEARTVASLSKMQVEEKLHNAYDLVDPDPDAPPSAVDLSVVATIAWACACRGVLDLGEDAAKRALSSKVRGGGGRVNRSSAA